MSATYERETKTVLCLDCTTVSHHPDPEAASGTTGPVLVYSTPSGPDSESASHVVGGGTAGASAQREYERRKIKREKRIRDAHPILGRLILALSDDPQSTKAWATGARGEELLGRVLDSLAGQGVYVLHDRRIPGTKANIDHVALAPTGVYVIDAKKYRRRPSLRVDGGIIRARTEKLMVGSRDCTKLVDGVRKQVDLVGSALEKAGIGGIPVHGMLCFVEADWPLFGGSFRVANMDVLWPKKAAEYLLRPGPVEEVEAENIYRALASSFPPA